MRRAKYINAFFKNSENISKSYLLSSVSLGCIVNHHDIISVDETKVQNHHNCTKKIINLCDKF